MYQDMVSDCSRWLLGLISRRRATLHVVTPLRFWNIWRAQQAPRHHVCFCSTECLVSSSGGSMEWSRNLRSRSICALKLTFSRWNWYVSAAHEEHMKTSVQNFVLWTKNYNLRAHNMACLDPPFYETLNLSIAPPTSAFCANNKLFSSYIQWYRYRVSGDTCTSTFSHSDCHSRMWRFLCSFWGKARSSLITFESLDLPHERAEQSHEVVFRSILEARAHRVIEIAFEDLLRAQSTRP